MVCVLDPTYKYGHQGLIPDFILTYFLETGLLVDLELGISDNLASQQAPEIISISDF